MLLSTVAALSVQSAPLRADTWRLEQGQKWEPVATKDKDAYLLAVARTEKLVKRGEHKLLAEEWEQLKDKFANIEAEDLDMFIKAEILFCKGKFYKAAYTYAKFLDAEYYDSALYQAALERRFHIGQAYLGGRKKRVLLFFEIRGYAEGVKIMDRISERAADRPIGLQAALQVAKYYERRNKWQEAYLKWSEISWQWQNKPIAKDALLAMARCKHAAYRGPRFNAAHLRSARTYYEDFALRYAQDAEELGIDEILDTIDEEMANKQLTIARYYDRTGKQRPANLYYDMVIRNWPETEAARRAKQELDGQEELESAENEDENL